MASLVCSLINYLDLLLEKLLLCKLISLSYGLFKIYVFKGLNKWAAFTALLMAFSIKTSILKHFIVSVCWWIKQWLLVCFGETALISAKATAVLPTVSFVPLVQVSMKWKKNYCYCERNFEHSAASKGSREPHRRGWGHIWDHIWESLC